MGISIRNKKIAIYFLFVVVIFLSAFLRLYKLDQIPPSLSWDETDVGYNAYTIANWGKDEWGESFPLVFKSFEDDKSPVHIYFTAVSVRFFGLSDFTTRLPVAIFGVLNVVILFFLARYFFKNDFIGLIASFFLAISPYNLQFSRFNHEANFALFFFMFGLWMFFKSLKGKNIFLPLSFLSFGISTLSYHSAKVVVPPIVLFLGVLYLKDLLKMKKHFLASILVLMMIILVYLFNLSLLGGRRLAQTSLPKSKIQETEAYKRTGNELAGRFEVTWNRYLSYFSPQYLFVSGDKIARHSTQAVGEFYKVDAIFLGLGFLALLLKRSKISLIIFSWAFLAPLPAAATGGWDETGHAARALFTMGSWHLISALGFYSLINLFKKPFIKLLVLVVGVLILSLLFKDYIADYYQDYSKKYATEWQYGVKQIVEYIKDHNGYSQVYMTDARSQPYIFFLYNLKTPLPKFLSTVEYNNTISRSYNLVSFFDKYYFGVGDPLQSMPTPGVIYAMTPSQYDGLAHKNVFDVKKRIRYPDGTDAFFLVSYP